VDVQDRPRHLIAPSLLAADFTRLGEQVQAVLAAGADWLHLDVMDHHYVPNLSVGPLVAEALRRRFPDAFLDVHLMVEPVDALAQDFAAAGASLISFHPEATRHVDRTIHLVRDAGCAVGLVLNPATPLAVLDYTLDQLDLVLVMSVNPGFGGQAFIPGALRKLAAVRARVAASGREVRVEVDGGIKRENIAACARAGADVFVAGTAVFGAPDPRTAVAALRTALDGAT
jgi:ribulose-phosphate 3-epimerase